MTHEKLAGPRHDGPRHDGIARARPARGVRGGGARGFPRWAVSGRFVRLTATGGTVGCATSCRRQQPSLSVAVGPLKECRRPTRQGAGTQRHFTMEGRRHEDCSSRARPGLRAPFVLHASFHSTPESWRRSSTMLPGREASIGGNGIDGFSPAASGGLRCALGRPPAEAGLQMTPHVTAHVTLSKWIGPWASFERV
jgi:hypothetical protein